MRGESVKKNEKAPESVWDLPLEELERLLTEQQKRFVAELERDGKPAEAAKRAGYSEKTAESQASRLLKNVKIAAYRRARSIDLYKRQGITPEWVGNELLEIYRRCMEAEPHLSWDREARAWMPDGTWVFDAKGALNAIGKIGESMGMFRPEKKQASEGGGQTVEEYLKGLGSGRKF